MNIPDKKWGLLLAALILALLCVSAQAEGTTNLWVYHGAGTGENIKIGTYEQGETVKAPDCPDTFAPPNPYFHFGGWRGYVGNQSVYLQPGDDIIMSGTSVDLTAQWYLNSEYTITDTLPNGMTWELHLEVGDYEGNAVETEANGAGGSRRYIRSGYLNITGEGAMPNYTEPFSSPWDSILYAMWQGGNGLSRRNIRHEGNGGSWNGAVPIAITLDDRITSIGSYCFTGNSSLFHETIHLPANLRRIEDHAFYENYYLFDVQLPDGLTFIGDYAFYGCHEMVATTEEILSYYYSSAYHSLPYSGLLVIPDSVTSIGSYAFARTAIFRVAFPHGLRHISEGVFCQARDLNYAYLPDVLESIGDYAFYGCGTSYEFPNYNGYGQAELRDYALTILPYAEVNDLLMLDSLRTIHLPASLRTLGEYSFYDCSDAYSVVIPEGVTEIPAYCFAGCRHLLSVTLPESLVTIGERAFNKAYYAGATVADIREIYIPKGVQHIDDYALGFRGNDPRQTMEVTGYRNTEAERYTLWGQNLDLSGSTNAQGLWTFIPLDKEDLYLFGSVNGGPVADHDEYKFEATETEGVYTLTATFPADSAVGLKRDKDDKDGLGILYYSAATAPGTASSAVLTDRGENPAADHLLFVPGLRKVIFTLTRNADGSFTLSYDLPTDYSICGAFTNWDYEPLTYNALTGTYEYSATLDPAETWNGAFDFYLDLNGDSYGAQTDNQNIFDSVSGLPLLNMMGADGNYLDDVGNLYLYSSGAGEYTFIFDPAACTLTVTTGETGGAWLMIPKRSTMPIRMKDPAQASGGEEEMMGEEGGFGVGAPADPYQFGGETTLWAGVPLYDDEEMNPYGFYIATAGKKYGDNASIFMEYAGESAKTVKIMGADPVYSLAGQQTDLQVMEDRSGIYDFYYGLTSHRIMVKRRTVNYVDQYDLGKVFDGARTSFYLETFVEPFMESADVTWYTVADGEETEYTDAFYWYEDGEVMTYTHYYGPFEVGDYAVVLRDQYGGLAVKQYFSITEGSVQEGKHSYALLTVLDKQYDGEPVDFDPYKDLDVDKGQSSWAALEKMGEAQYVWKMLDGKGYVEMKDVPTEAGQYQLVIQELIITGGKIGEDVIGGSTTADVEWVDVAAFDFAITGAHVHVYLDPVWNWDEPYAGTVAAFSVTATFTCAECQESQTLTAGIRCTLTDGLVVYVASVEFDGAIFTDTHTVQDGILILPAGLTVIESEAFSGVAAQGVVIPRSVTEIGENAFPAGITVYGFNSVAQSYAAGHGLRYVALTE